MEIRLTELEALKAEVARLDTEMQAVLDFAMHMAKILINSDLDRCPPEEVPHKLAALKSTAAERGDGPLTGANIQMQVYRHIIADRAQD